MKLFRHLRKIVDVFSWKIWEFSQEKTLPEIMEFKRAQALGVFIDPTKKTSTPRI